MQSNKEDKVMSDSADYAALKAKLKIQELKGKTEDFVETAIQKAENLLDKTDELVDSGKDNAEYAALVTKIKAEDLTETVKDKSEELVDKGKELTEIAKGTIKGVVEGLK